MSLDHAGADGADRDRECGTASPRAERACSGLCGLARIVLHLARCHDFPEGSAAHGYAFVAPLDAQGHLDVEAWRGAREACIVRRFWGEESDRLGHLTRLPGGEGGATWAFTFHDAKGDTDETGIHMARHVFRPGEYVSIRRNEDEVVTLQVAEIGKACRG